MPNIIMPDDIIDEMPFMVDDDEEPSCRVCGCTHYDPCTTANGTCFWIEPDLYSACYKREADA